MSMEPTRDDRIELTEETIRCWAERLGVDEGTLRDAVDLFGADVNAVSEAIEYLKIACQHLREGAVALSRSITLH
jgi:hypothetical protein